MKVERNISKDLIIPQRLLNLLGIKGRSQIVFEKGEVRIKPIEVQKIALKMAGLGENVASVKESSVDLQRRIRKEWRI